MHGVPSSMRSRALVDTAWGARPAAARNPKGWFVDLSQSVERASKWGQRFCFRRNTICFSFEEDRVLNAREMLGLQGFPVKDFDLSILPVASKLHCYAGESMFLPSIGTILMAALCVESAPWISESADF